MFIDGTLIDVSVENKETPNLNKTMNETGSVDMEVEASPELSIRTKYSGSKSLPITVDGVSNNSTDSKQDTMTETLKESLDDSNCGSDYVESSSLEEDASVIAAPSSERYILNIPAINSSMLHPKSTDEIPNNDAERKNPEVDGDDQLIKSSEPTEIPGDDKSSNPEPSLNRDACDPADRNGEPGCNLDKPESPERIPEPQTILEDSDLAKKPVITFAPDPAGPQNELELVKMDKEIETEISGPADVPNSSSEQHVAVIDLELETDKSSEVQEKNGDQDQDRSSLFEHGTEEELKEIQSESLEVDETAGESHKLAEKSCVLVESDPDDSCTILEDSPVRTNSTKQVQEDLRASEQTDKKLSEPEQLPDKFCEPEQVSTKKDSSDVPNPRRSTLLDISVNFSDDESDRKMGDVSTSHYWSFITNFMRWNLVCNVRRIDVSLYKSKSYPDIARFSEICRALFLLEFVLEDLHHWTLQV